MRNKVLVPNFMAQKDVDHLEALVKQHGLPTVLFNLALVCSERADEYQPGSVQAERWNQAAEAILELAYELEKGV